MKKDEIIDFNIADMNLDIYPNMKALSERIDMKEKALKLADELDDFYKHHNQPYLLTQLQDMIRKLIAELDKPMQIMPDGTIKPVFNELDKQGEPVGWFHTKDGTYEFDWHWGCKMQGTDLKVPLYTAPQKRLSDEEIKAIIVQHIQTWNSLDSIIDFARAIEKEHGIT